MAEAEESNKLPVPPGAGEPHPLQVEPATREDNSANKAKATGRTELSWVIIGGLIIPFGLTVPFRGLLVGWNSQVIDAPNLAFCLASLSLAIFVRVATREDSMQNPWLPWIFVLLLFQVVFAWYLSGTFHTQRADAAQIDHDMSYVKQAKLPGAATSSESGEQQEVLQILDEAKKSNSPSGAEYVIFCLTGGITAVYVFRLWDPVTGKGRRRK